MPTETTFTSISPGPTSAAGSGGDAVWRAHEHAVQTAASISKQRRRAPARSISRIYARTGGKPNETAGPNSVRGAKVQPCVSLLLKPRATTYNSDEPGRV